jgi:hypothetical protein
MTLFEVRKLDGTGWLKPRGLRRTMLTARLRLHPGAGHFTVDRITTDGGHYHHKDLRRGRALRVLRAILREINVDAGASVRNKKNRVVFHAERVRPPVQVLYQNPLRSCAGVRGLRIDQGVDYSVTERSPVYAIGAGVVTVFRPSSGWPWDENHKTGGSYIAYKLTEGPLKGLYVYDAEHITLHNLNVGSRVNANTVIAYHLPGYANCEMGWGLPSNQGYSPLANNYYIEGDRTAAGESFNRFMRSLGAPSGLTEGRSVVGRNPAGYP